jgi:hypothetical protein
MSETNTDVIDAEGACTTADGAVKLVPQAEQLKNPDARILLAIADKASLLGEYASSIEGLSTGDGDRFVLSFWELASRRDETWEWYIQNVEATTDYGGRSEVIRWEAGGGDLHNGSSAHNFPARNMNGRTILGRDGLRVTQMGPMACTIYTGEIFGKNAATVVPHNPEHLAAMYEFCRSVGYRPAIRVVDQSLKVTVGSLLKVPFDLAHWQRVAAEKFPGGLPEPQSDDSTQWLFHGHPAGKLPNSKWPNGQMETVLQVAVARLVGYKWPAELDPKMRLAPEARAWVEKCKDLERFADDDGVVPLVNINKERPGHERVRALLEAAFGERWTPGLLNDLLAAAGAPGKSLDDWLKHDFFAQHCSVFHHRPFVWQIWDGKKDGFNILVHYHRLAEGEGKGKKLLEKIVYTHLGDWITQQKQASKEGVAGADSRERAATDLQKKLEAILKGEPPYDIFVRWKPLHEQPIGWQPDINDGIRMNIRPFVTAGVLRGKVNVKWTKDRGKEPESIRPKAQFPWFWSCPEEEPPVDFAGGAKFTGERLNDLHYTRSAKEATRRAAGRAT